MDSQSVKSLDSQSVKSLEADVVNFLKGKKLTGIDVKKLLLKYHPDKAPVADFSPFPSIKGKVMTGEQRTHACTVITQVILNAKEVDTKESESKSGNSNKFTDFNDFKNDTEYTWTDYDTVMKSFAVDMTYFVGEVYWTCPHCGGQTTDRSDECLNQFCDFSISEAKKNKKEENKLHNKLEKQIDRIVSSKNFRTFAKTVLGVNPVETDFEEMKELYFDNEEDYDNFVSAIEQEPQKQIAVPKQTATFLEDNIEDNLQEEVVEPTFFSSSSVSSAWDD
ncbi:MAG: hypothetical protein Terrestrivirus4_186 [Terrestrivirus sp.]|uniref:Uncharacterized protein n=1 Tax=Terrestrivirus sp. TaxID=2487775 RepID=A0A3G4ZMR9_9VIRU|nr:MAG: hypothetical protein Terrestrivirus4_186 [Terrestrivirus sp.]